MCTKINKIIEKGQRFYIYIFSIFEQGRHVADQRFCKFKLMMSFSRTLGRFSKILNSYQSYCSIKSHGGALDHNAYVTMTS